MRATDQLYVAVKVLAALRSQWWSAKHIREFQDRALIRMMRHAALNVPFYRRLNLRPESIVSATDLARFPVISKRQIQCDPEAFMAAGFAPATLYASRTSGSSGEPTTTLFDREAWLLSKYALKMRRVVATAGIPVGRRLMIISEQPPERRARLLRLRPRDSGCVS